MAAAVVGPVVIWAHQPLAVAPAIGNDSPAVAADIRKGAVLSVVAPDYDERFAAEFVGEVVADVRRFFHAANANPLAQEQALLFERQHIGVGVEGARHRPRPIIRPGAVVSENLA